MAGRIVLVLVSVFALIFGLLPNFVPAEPAAAADASSFQPGNIISDAIFFDGSAMSAGTVQNFLSSRVASCRSGYTCLKDYSQSTPTMGGDSYCSAYTGSGGETAASIIAKVGQACGISQKVLLVLLDKEQSLVSSAAPTSYSYRNATGFSCPDTAPCDPAFSGFFFQVYYAARQFKVYAATPTSWNYRAGRTNRVYYNPNTSCGSSNLYIENQATAGLYIYTPYQPNAAALGNLYGTGDGCSAYGNRNFWRMFTDWFGSTVATALVRTVDNPTVYLASSGKKFPIPSMEILNVYSSLGSVSYVSQNYIDSLSTGRTASRIIRSTDGSIFFVDSGIKLPFGSCAQVVDYGGSCNSDGYIQIDDAQAAAFRTGPAVGGVLGTPSGIRYVIQAGTKREVLDTASLSQSNLGWGNYNVLSENAVSYLPFGSPIVRDSVFASNSTTGESVLLMRGQRFGISNATSSATGISSKSVGNLKQESLALIPDGGSGFTGSVMVDGNASPVNVLSGGNRYEMQPGSASISPSLSVTPAVLAQFPLAGSIGQGTLLKSPDNGSIYIVMPNDIRPISSWDTLLFISSSPSWITVPSNVLYQFSWGPVALKGGNLYRSPDDATVFLINGLGNKIPFSKFDFPFEAGYNQFSFTSQDRLDAYPYSGSLLTYGVKCGRTSYISAGGLVHQIPEGMENLYPFAYVELDTFMCKQLKGGVPAGYFIRTPDGVIYYLAGGEKRPVPSMARYQQLGPDQYGYLNVSYRFADMIPTGPAA